MSVQRNTKPIVLNTPEINIKHQKKESAERIATTTNSI
jgi:hypothetical protein